MSHFPSMGQALDVASAPIEIPEESSIAETIRRSHIRAENDVKAIGALILASVVLQTFDIFGSSEPLRANLLMLVLIMATGAIGVLLRKLDPIGRWLYTMMTIIGLAGAVLEAPAVIAFVTSPDVQSTMDDPFPYVRVAVWAITAIVPPLVVVVLWGRRWRTVTSRRYRDTVIPATPHIEDRRNTLPMFAAVLVPLVTFLAFGIIMEITGNH